MNVKEKAASWLTPLFVLVVLGAVGYGVYSQWRAGKLGVAHIQVQQPDFTTITAGAEKAFKSFAKKGDEPKTPPALPEATPKAPAENLEPPAAETNTVPPPVAKPVEPAPDPKPEKKQTAEPQTPPATPSEAPVDTKSADVKEDPAPAKESVPGMVAGDYPPSEDSQVATAPESSYDAGEKQNVSDSEVLWGKSVQECLIEMKSDCIVTRREKDGRLSTWCPSPQDSTARMCDERAEATVASE